MRQVELGGVRGYQDDRKLRQAFQRSTDVRHQNPVGIDGRVVEEAVRRFQFRLGQRLRKRTLRTLGQPTGQLDEPTASPRVAQVGRAEFLHRPIGIHIQ